MEGIRLCVIDECLETSWLRSLVPDCPQISIFETQDKSLLMRTPTAQSSMKALGHGTLCTAVLIESMRELGILQKVELFHFSIGYLAGHRSEHALLEGMEFCLTHNIDLISCSIGIFQRTLAKPLISLLHGIRKPLVIAAAANNRHITYPAALPSALGVKISEASATCPCAVTNPPDGIDLLAQCSKSTVLEQSEYGVSNSILAPQVCAQSARLVLQGIPLERESVLSALAGGKFAEILEKPILFGLRNPDDDPLVIALLYSDENYSRYYDLAVRLQRKFEENGYSCGILSDRLSKADFEMGHFPVDPQHIKSDIAYYVLAAEDSLYLLITERESPCDLLFDEKWLENQLSDTVPLLFQEILAAFPDR